MTMFLFDSIPLGVKLSAADFRDVWMHYDSDGNGFIEEQEINKFLSDLFEAQGQIISKSDIAGLKQTLLECYDLNRDGKIELSEMSKILPVEENFLLKFKIQNRPLTYPNFLRIWEYYDRDNSGRLERKELESFMTDLIRTNRNISIKEAEMDLIMNEIYSHFDGNHDKLIEQDELKLILQVPTNFLDHIELYKNLNKQEFTEIFEHYDRDRDGFLEGEELMEIVSDMMRKVEIDLTVDQLENLVEKVVRVIDTNFDGKISKKELSDLFFTSGQISPIPEPEPSGSDT
ncbi:calretinin-like [Bolinopsis microptera]|uniref:calretinin-like n=1 Tax=Bolinopsis microptera TaxID=2820187 RepID=UPI00307A697E